MCLRRAYNRRAGLEVILVPYKAERLAETKPATKKMEMRRVRASETKIEQAAVIGSLYNARACVVRLRTGGLIDRLFQAQYRPEEHNGIV